MAAPGQSSQSATDQPEKLYLPQMTTYPDEGTVGQAAADLVAEKLRLKPASVLLLPTGRTPLPMYARLVARWRAERPDLSPVQTFNLDEFYGLPPDHPGSYRTYMRRVLFDHLPVPSDNYHLLNGAAADPTEECRAYEAKIEAAGGVDLAVLGIGANGHIGFNEPGSTLASRTRLVTIEPTTRAANAFLFDQRLDAVPQTALTVGIATILASRQVLLLVTGPSKAVALTHLLTGPVSPDFPASFLRLHPQVTILADREASSS